MKNQSVVENYWAVKLWVMRPDRAQRKVFWWFCLFSSISKSKRVLCLRQRAERGGWESLTADASTPGDTEPDMLGLRGGGKVQAMYSLSWTCLQPYIFLSWFQIKWHWLHVEPTYDLWQLIIIWKGFTINTNNHSRNFSNINKNIFQPGDNLSCNNKWQVKT